MHGDMTKQLWGNVFLKLFWINAQISRFLLVIWSFMSTHTQIGGWLYQRYKRKLEYFLFCREAKCIVCKTIDFLQWACNLTPSFLYICWQTYFVTITAVSSAGNVEVTSDGVTGVEENSPLTGVVVFDGEPCDHKGK